MHYGKYYKKITNIVEVPRIAAYIASGVNSTAMNNTFTSATSNHIMSCWKPIRLSTVHNYALHIKFLSEVYLRP